MKKFKIHSQYAPAGDQPAAINELVEGINNGLSNQVLLGVTGYKSCLDTRNLVRLLSEIAEIKIIVTPQANSMLSSAGLALDVLGDEEEWYRWRQVRHATRACNSDTIPLIINNPY